jgi:hypothetical protein
MKTILQGTPGMLVVAHSPHRTLDAAVVGQGILFDMSSFAKPFSISKSIGLPNFSPAQKLTQL